MKKLNTLHTIKNRIASCFNQAASSYDTHAILQQEIGKRCLERLSYIKINPATILDLGAATGKLTQQLSAQYHLSNIIGIDIAEQLLLKAKNDQLETIAYLSADMEQLPFSNNSIDLVFSNLSLQWCKNPQFTFAEVFRVLKPNGCFLFTTLGPDTLYELRDSWQAVDSQHQHTNKFLDMHIVGDKLLKTKFADPVIDKEYLTLTYPSPLALLKDLKAVGAHAVLSQTSPSLTGKHKLHSMFHEYEQFKNPENLFPATYEVIYGHACKPQTSSTTPKNSPQEWVIPVDSIKKKNSHE